MKVESKQLVKTTTDISVCKQLGSVVIRGVCSDGTKWEKRVVPCNAVGLWRVCMGERQYIDIRDKGADKPYLSLVFRQKENDWELCDGEALAFFNADQALAFGWALQACTVGAVSGRAHSEDTKEISLSNVWSLTVKTVLGGDTTAEGVDLIGGYDRVFSSQSKARDALREILRVQVNEAETEDHWLSTDEKVDDVIDRIMDEEQKIDETTFAWLYDGLKQSFEVTLAEHRIDGAV